MKKNFLTILGIALGLAAPGAFAASVVLAPGTSIPLVPDNGTTFPGIEVASMSGVTLTNSLNSAESATLSEMVYRTTGGTLDFFYQLTNTSSGGDALNTAAFRNFTGFMTSVGYVTGNGGTVAPTNSAGANEASRSTSGDTVNFFFQSNGGDGQFPAGSTTYYLEIDTNATTFDTNGTAGVIDGGDAQVGSIYSPAGSPSSVPEPVSMGLLGGGLALVGVARWRRSRKA